MKMDDVVCEYEEDVEALCSYVSLRKVIPFDVRYWRYSAGSGEGDNYMSVVKRIEVSTHGFDSGMEMHKGAQYFSFIVKRQILSQSRRTLFRCDEAFCNEINAYTHVVPVLEKYFVNGDTVFPQCYYAGTDKKGELIALKDLTKLGYRMPNRLVPFDLHHCEIVMRELAKLHATSIAAKHLDDSDFRERYCKVNEIVYCREAENFYGNLLTSSIEESLKSLRESNIDGSLSDPIYLIEQLKTELYQKIMHMINNASDCVSVMCHGDLYVNNIMFKSCNEENDTYYAPKEVKFFDLQAMRYTSFIFDILHFMFTSTKRDLRDAHTNRLLETYRSALHNRLEKLLSSREHLASIRRTFSLANIMKEFSTHALYGLAVSMWVLPAITFDPNNIPNLDVISEAVPKANEIKVTQKLTEEYHSRIKDLALEFHENGYFGPWLEK
ncbi:uncharacterized protein LOC128861710 [Anastrepha ludens]|uniref:uncharacterized protein LOC128861710 n=1 Tax=Anastrepha ludens TaxID=28586 RepID=UPI0023B05BC9|nr:uncharacterized protein LOC128861710 [Anastrepha ludens]XP_053956025.1 uncharacterized protein LOC128861710 [Anastrepha ludens]